MEHTTLPSITRKNRETKAVVCVYMKKHQTQYDMKRTIALPLLLITFMCGCTKESTEKQPIPSFIQGAKVASFASSSRNGTTEESLPIGSNLTFYSQGGIQAEEKEFSYNGTSWESDVQTEWEDTPQKATVTAFCPPLYRSQNEFYQDGRLRDQLMAQGEYAYKESIILSFRHLFAQILFKVSHSLNQQISQIEFTPSVSVSDISPETGEITYQHTVSSLCMDKEQEGIYSFLIPPTSQSIHIRLHTTTGSIHESTLETYPFQAGYTYTCPLKLSGEAQGISTVEDFIAFTYLINGESYGKRSLEEFGKKTGEKMTYYLNEDLTFTPEEAARVQMIGKYGFGSTTQKKAFNDIFDGQGHSLNNLRFEQPVDGSYYAGLFSGISATGVVRNLILSQAVYDKEEDTKKAAFLAGINLGEINHCILRDCTVENLRDDGEFGNISSRNEGIIANCQLHNIKFKNEVKVGSGITRYHYGKIINCAVNNCQFKKTSIGGGLICNIIKNGEIQNCYVSGNISQCYAICQQVQENNIIRCCFYPQSYTKAPIGNDYKSAPSDSLLKYGNQQAITEENLPKVLNQWISDSGKRLFPNLSFNTWEQGETLPAILVSP